MDELPPVKLRQELMERHLDHRGPVQTLVQRLRMSLSIENKCKQIMRQKITHVSRRRKDDYDDEDDGDDYDDDDDYVVENDNIFLSPLLSSFLPSLFLSF